MYEGFRRFDIQTSDPQVTIRGVVGGSGPPVLLLHGNPLTHYHWRFVAPRLAKDFTVVATDLRGYGDSGKPRGLADHGNYSFRRMAQDQVDVMRHLGYERFMVAGHDRGARTAYRMALDHPAAVLKLCAIDILPTHHVWTHVTREWALNSYHWSFMAQPYDFPERLLAGKEEYYIRLKLGSQGMGKGGFTEDAIQEYVRCCTRSPARFS
jgi:haloacetate dehalogenase